MQGKDGFSALASELERRFQASGTSVWPEEQFTGLALESFALQFETVTPYRRLCESRGRTPATVSRWQDVPTVPASAFKHLDLSAAGHRHPEAVFLTSGTTRGRETRGRHLVPSLSLYRHALLPTFDAYLLEGSRMPVISLIPSWSERSDSSLSFMVDAAAAALATETVWVVDGQGVLDHERLRSALTRAERAGVPVLLAGTALALLHAVEHLEATSRVRLLEGTRIMETGGFKGAGRDVLRAELHERIEAAIGVSRAMIVGEYGMTELLSQLYEPVLSEGPSSAGTYAPAPWLRVRALDPMTLEETPSGSPGLLSFYDLANAGSICHVVTEDLGSVSEGRVRLHGRLAGAEPRGCSIAMDELMSAARAARSTKTIGFGG